MARAERIRTALTLAMALLCSWANATMVQFLNLDDILMESDLIVEATVVSVESRWADNGHTIYTYVTFDDRSMVYGEHPGGSLILRFEGGEIDGYQVVTAGIPSFAVGDRELLMIKDREGGVSPIVGLFQGRFRIISDEVLDNLGRPILGVEENVLVKLGTDTASNDSNNSLDISQGFPDERDYEFRPGVAESSVTGARVGIEAPRSWEISQEVGFGGPDSVRLPPVEALIPGVWGVRISPDKKYSRYVHPAEDSGTRLSTVEFADYIRQRLRELGKSQ